MTSDGVLSNLMLPKEHGASVMLGVGLAAGMAAAGSVSVGAIATALAAAGAFLLRLPVVRAIRLRDSARPAVRRRIRWSLTAFGLLTGIGGAVLLWSGVAPLLLPLIACALPLVTAILVLGSHRRDRDTVTELLACLTFALAAAATQVTSSGGVTWFTWQVWAACGLFFTGSVLHIRGMLAVRRTAARGRVLASSHQRWYWMWSVLVPTVGFAGAGLGALPWAFALAQVPALARPILLRGWVVERPARIGAVESLLMGVFVLLIATGN